jgi:hypothetical protein
MITFKNGTTFETVANMGGSMQYQSAKRNTLEFHIPKDSATFDSLKAIYANTDALSEITVTTAEATSLHTGYTLPIEMGLRTENDAEVWYIKLAQKSALELKVEQLEKAVAALTS